MYKTLLVPLDGSRLAETVLPIVQHLAAVWEATVILLHVIERGAPQMVHGERHLMSVVEADPYLEELASQLRSRGITVEIHAHPAPEGDVARSIVAHGQETGADLTILSTHGSGRVRDLFFGRIAQQVLRRGSTPVLLIRPEAMGADPRFELQTVVVPLDASPDAEEALEPAIAFARSAGASVRLVMVVPTQETVRGDRQAVRTLLPAATRAALDLEGVEAQTYLTALAQRLQAGEPDVPISIAVRRGDITTSLVEETAQPDVNLVIIATHGRAGLQAMWVGSVTAQLLDRTHVPILLLRAVTTGTAKEER